MAAARLLTVSEHVVSIVLHTLRLALSIVDCACPGFRQGRPISITVYLAAELLDLLTLTPSYLRPPRLEPPLEPLSVSEPRVELPPLLL
jgi:hypothetical protein